MGKTTVSRLLARRLGYRLVDTGNMYRALAWKALRLRVDLDDEAALSRLAAETRMEVEFEEDLGNSLVVDGWRLRAELRQPEVERAVSPVSRLAGVRQEMVARQRELAGQGGVVMAGRDIGTVVLPGAEVKVFLDASPQERARRRFLELQERGQPVKYEEILEELQRRDELDRQRPLSPLRPAEDAIIINTEGLSPQQVVDRICRLWKEE